MTTPADLAAVDRLHLLDTPPEERFDRITRLAQERLDVPIALVNVAAEDTVWTKSQPAESTLSFGHVPWDDSFCVETLKKGDILEVPDAAADPVFADKPAVRDEGLRYYAGFPIRTQAGEAVGTFCLVDMEPRRLEPEQLELFRGLGAWAQAEMRSDDSAVVAPTTRVRGESVEDVVTSGSGIRLASLALPFGELSGDRAAWRQVGGKVAVTLTDIMGKGEIASGFADTLIEVLHARTDLPPVQAMLAVEDYAREAGTYRDTFATVFHARIDPHGGVEYIDAGHGLTLVIRSDGTTHRVSSRNLPLGLRPRGISWEDGATTLGRGDVLVSVSDGALDAYDSTLDSLRQIAADLRRAHGVDTFFDELTVRVSEHVVDDDVTAVVVSIH